MTINRIRAPVRQFTEEGVPACVTILLTGDHDGCRRTGRPQFPCCSMSRIRTGDTLGRRTLFEVRGVYRRHPFRIAGTAGIRYPAATLSTVPLIPGCRQGVISARYPGRTPSSLVSSIQARTC